MLGLERIRDWIDRRFGKLDTITGLNTGEDVENATRDTLRFHLWIKEPLRIAIKNIRVKQAWIDNLSGNRKVMWDIIQKYYLPFEKQTCRKDLMLPLMEYGCCLPEYDTNYPEVMDALIYGIIQERDRFTFDPATMNPDNWCTDSRGRMEEKVKPVRVLSISDTHIVTSERLTEMLTKTYENGLLKPSFKVLDFNNMTEPYPGIFVYPVLTEGPALDYVIDKLAEVTA